ncbi:unnamed protein product [Calicophoron daubneyi]|uniref:EF-hand domain-containing protein n=1 Tax=Calicophoron daubneyi TaxID=300641 RepID=A0AAV2TS67_CALDB
MKVKELQSTDLELIYKTFKFFSPKDQSVMPISRMGDALRWMKLIPSEAQLQKYAELIDPDNTGEIDVNKFMITAADLWFPTPKEMEKHLWAAFEVFDQSLTGTISSELLKDILVHTGTEPIPISEADKLIKQYEDKETHQVSYSIIIHELME